MGVPITNLDDLATWAKAQRAQSEMSSKLVNPISGDLWLEGYAKAMEAVVSAIENGVGIFSAGADEIA